MPDERRADPVCGVQVSSDSPYRLVHGGRELVFCSEACLDAFRRNPRRYAVAPREARSERR
jgi:P-type Cu+ transporter